MDSTDRNMLDETTGRRSRKWLWAIAVVAVLALVGVGVSMLASSDSDDRPTLTWDGEAATYQGPDTLEAGEVTLVLKNDSDRDVGFVWGHHVEEGHTMQETLDWVTEHPSSPPPWVGQTADIGPMVEPQTTVERTTTIPPGPTDLLAWDGTAHPATIILVTDS